MSRAAKPGQDAPGSPGDFLERWSRRKAGVRDRTARPDHAGTVTAPPPAGETESQPEQDRQPALTDADMPPLDTLDAGSDFVPFMSPGVSDELRRKALRILFRSPACNLPDGLNDYDEDYTQFAHLGSVITREMKRQLKRALDTETSGETGAANRTQEDRSAGTDTPAAEPVNQMQDPSQVAAGGQPDRDADDEADKV